MKELVHSFKDALGKGLTPLVDTPKNVPALKVSEGAFPRDGCLVTPGEDYTELDLSSLNAVYPYPQVFITKVGTFVCDRLVVYQRTDAGTLSAVFTGSTEGTTWSIADFGTYILLSNGIYVIARNPDTGAWTDVTSSSFPAGSALCSVAGQILVGSPNLPAEFYNDFTLFHYTTNWLHTLIHTNLPGVDYWLQEA